MNNNTLIKTVCYFLIFAPLFATFRDLFWGSHFFYSLELFFSVNLFLYGGLIGILLFSEQEGEE